MLAKVQPFTPEALESFPPPEGFLMTVNLTAAVNPSPDPLTSNQFFLTKENGDEFSGLIKVDEGVTEVQISITLDGGASFASPPLVWSLAPQGGGPVPEPTDDNTVITFNVPAPGQVLLPWVFRFIANIPGANGVWSQSIIVAQRASSSSLTLKYQPASGAFSIVNDPESDFQDGAVLGADLVMVNTQFGTPFGSEFPSISLTLVSDPPITPEPLFTGQGIYWSSGEAPLWVQPWAPITEPTSTVSFDINSLALGQSTGLQFAIAVTDASGNSVTVLSPDPVIINSTIGDG